MDPALREIYARESLEAYNKFMRNMARKSAGPMVTRKIKKDIQASSIKIDGTVMKNNDIYQFP